MAEIEQPIIKRITIEEAGGHGGAWKVAYADFVTAMMAFFLLMWLLNATTEEQRKGIADYFNPSIPIAAVSGGGRNALNGDTVTSEMSMSSATKEMVDVPSQEDLPLPKLSDEETQGENPDLGETPEAVIQALESALSETSPELAEHVNLRLSEDGLVIELTDRDQRPLFTSGSAAASPILRRLCMVVAEALTDVENPIKIAGHTDSLQFISARDYTNWELSSDRANVARRLIIGAGFPESRIREVSGKAATVPLVADPMDPRNRRISLTLMRSSR